MLKFARFLPRRWWSSHAWKIWSRYVHWRLETYGMYYPDGRWNSASFRLLLKQSLSYSHWLSELDRLRRSRC